MRLREATADKTANVLSLCVDGLGLFLNRGDVSWIVRCSQFQIVSLLQGDSCSNTRLEELSTKG